MGLPRPPDLDPKVEAVVGSAVAPGLTSIAKTLVGTPFRIADSVKNAAFNTADAILGQLRL